MTAVSAEEGSRFLRRSWNVRAGSSHIYLNARSVGIALGTTNLEVHSVTVRGRSGQHARPKLIALRLIGKIDSPPGNGGNLKVGSIESSGLSVGCFIHRQSETGAWLEVASPIGLPAQFTLVVAPDRTKHRCTILWRTGKMVGVKFL